MSNQPPYSYGSPSETPDDQEPLYPPPGSQAPYTPFTPAPSPYTPQQPPYAVAHSQPLALSPVSPPPSASIVDADLTTEQATPTPYNPYAQGTPPAPYDPYAQYGPQLNAPTYFAPPSYQAQPYAPGPSQPLYQPQPQQPLYQQPIIAQPMVIAPIIVPVTVATPPPIPGAGAALNSMVLGIVALIAALLSVIPIVGLCTWPVSFILATIGVITGLVGLRSTTNRGQAITGLILSGIALAILGLVLLVVIAGSGHH